jgi:hypothetical protein
MPETTGIRIGVVAAADHRDWAEALAEALPGTLGDRVGADVEWRVDVCEAGPADVADGPRELTDAVRRRLLDRGWELGIGLTTLPLADRHRPVATYASGSHGVGIVSIPALGAVHVEQRLHDAAAELIETLLGDADDGRGRRAVELAGELAAERAERDGTLRFAGRVTRGNLRLLGGMIRANRPMRVVVRLSRSSAAALGTGAYALSSSSIWILAHQSSVARLAAVAVVSMLLILIAMLIAHDLWERVENPAARERVVLFNIVTLVTLTIGIATLYVGLFVVLVLAAAVAIPPSALEQQISASPTVGEYARLAWFAASVATVGGALGSLVESNDAIREAVYHPRRVQSD